MSAGRRRPADADARWSEACEWHDAAHETEIEAELARHESDRDDEHWMRLAVIALDQAGIDPGRVRL